MANCRASIEDRSFDPAHSPIPHNPWEISLTSKPVRPSLRYFIGPSRLDGKRPCYWKPAPPRRCCLLPANSTSCPATVNEDGLTGDQRGSGRGQEHHCASYIHGLADAVQRGDALDH